MTLAAATAAIPRPTTLRVTFMLSSILIRHATVTVLGMVAEVDRERQQAGIEAAKARGTYRGRKPSVPVDRVRALSNAANADGQEQLWTATRLGSLAGGCQLQLPLPSSHRHV
jgi:hypothetical protein